MSSKHPIKNLPSVEYLRECFDYSPETGELRWKKRPTSHFATKSAAGSINAKNAGTVAGRMDGHDRHDRDYRYRRVRIGNIRFKTHRIIWKMMTGVDPEETVDHIDGNTWNDRWDNLRLATGAEQSCNKGLYKNNTSGRKGVIRYMQGKWPNKYWKGKWVAQIQHDRVNHYVGIFDSVEEAAAAYEMTAQQLHGEFAGRTK